MGTRGLFKQALMSCNPSSYRKLTAEKTRETIRRTWHLVLLLLLLMLVIGIPQLAKLPSNVQDALQAFEEFSVNSTIITNDSITLSNYPHIVVDTSKENLTDEKILFNDKGIQVKRGLFRKTKTTQWQTITDVEAHAEQYGKWTIALVILLLPSLLLLIGTIAVAEAVIVATIATVLILLITKATSFHISAKQAMKISIRGLVPLLALQLLPLFYIRWLWIPLALYVLLVALATWYVGEGKRERRSNAQARP